MTARTEPTMTPRQALALFSRELASAIRWKCFFATALVLNLVTSVFKDWGSWIAAVWVIGIASLTLVIVVDLAYANRVARSAKEIDE